MDEAWIEAYEAQATDELYEKATRYAASRAWGVAKLRGKDDDLYVRELVQDAFTDTLAGVLSWDPSRASLEAHVINAIRGRSRHDREHAKKFRAAELDPRLPANGEERGADAVEARAAEVMGALRGLAANDNELLRLLDAFAAGAAEKEELMAEAKLGAKPYRNARIRLARLVRQLPPEMHDAARRRA